MKFSETRKEVFAAYAKVRGQIKQPNKDGQANYSKYVTLDAMEKAITAAEQDTGISHSQELVSGDKSVSVTTYIFHSSGEYIEFEPFTLPAQKMDAQAFGSAATYARRYSLAAAYAIVSDDDDDGNRAVEGVGNQSANQRTSRRQSTRPQNTQHNTAKPAPQGPTPQQRVDQAAANAVKAMGGDKNDTMSFAFAKAGIVFNSASWNKLSDEQATAVINVINAAQQAAAKRNAKQEA